MNLASKSNPVTFTHDYFPWNVPNCKYVRVLRTTFRGRKERMRLHDAKERKWKKQQESPDSWAISLQWAHTLWPSGTLLQQEAFFRCLETITENPVYICPASHPFAGIILPIPHNRLASRVQIPIHKGSYFLAESVVHFERNMRWIWNLEAYGGSRIKRIGIVLVKQERCRGFGLGSN